jgi:hypothetical protein
MKAMNTVDLKDFYRRGDKTFMPHLSVDCVIFGFHQNELKVLLLKWKAGPWCLPGGFIKYKESVDDAAIRDMLGCVRGKCFAGYASELIR